MFILAFVPQYFLWHYVKGFRAFLHVWTNLIWGINHFFGIGTLARSLFAPWKRVTESSRGKWDFDAIAGAFVVNMMSRFIGVILRLILIFVGVTVLIIFLLSGVVALTFWVFAPLIIFVTFGYGVFLILSGLYVHAL